MSDVINHDPRLKFKRCINFLFFRFLIWPCWLRTIGRTSFNSPCKAWKCLILEVKQLYVLWNHRSLTWNWTPAFSHPFYSPFPRMVKLLGWWTLSCRVPSCSAAFYQSCIVVFKLLVGLRRSSVYARVRVKFKWLQETITWLFNSRVPNEIG